MASHQKMLLDGLNELYSEGLLCDFSLKAGAECFHVHRCVLAASSPYFRAMLTLDTCENTCGSTILQNVDGAVLHDLVKFIYSGEIDVNSSNVQSLLVAADMFQYTGLVKQCEEFLSTSLSNENCLEIYNFADFQNLTSLKDASKTYALNNFENVCNSAAFLELSVQSVKELLGSFELNVLREEVVYKALMIWVKHDKRKREENLMSLLFCVRFPLIDVEYVANTVMKEELIINNLFCHQLLHKYLSAFSPDGDSAGKEMFCGDIRLGMYNKKMIVFSGGAFSAIGRAFSCFDPETCQSFYSVKHHPTFDFKFKLDFYRLISTEWNDIYCLGGIFYDDYHFEAQGTTAKNDVLIYEQNRSIWQPCTPMPMPRCAFGACYFSGKIYVFGGYMVFPGHQPLDSVAAYDTTTDKWIPCEEMPIGIAHQATVTHKNSALLFGGVDSEEHYLNTILQYHFENDRWTLIASEMPIPRAEASAFAHNDRIVILGGFNSSGGVVSVHSLSLDKLRWYHGTDFPAQRKFTSVCQGDGYLYVCGGVKQSTVRPGSSRVSKTIETKDLFRYNLAKDLWENVTRFVNHGSSYACVYASVNSMYLKQDDEEMAHGKSK